MTGSGSRHGRDLWPVKADVNQLEQVIVNLAVNARDAMPSGGRLSIRTLNVSAREASHLSVTGMPPADYVVIEVADTGSGIPPELRDKIFEPFFTTKPVGEGTGLGLDICYRVITQRHGGDLRVLSEPGDTRFQVRLPMARAGTD